MSISFKERRDRARKSEREDGARANEVLSSAQSSSQQDFVLGARQEEEEEGPQRHCGGGVVCVCVFIKVVGVTRVADGWRKCR